MFKRIFIISVSLFCFAFNTIAGSYYWVNGTGNWSDYLHHWATTSGGNTFHTQIPTPSDDVYFDSHSFVSVTDSLDFDSTVINCHTMIWNGSLPVHIYSSSTSSTLDIYGSFILTPGLIWKPGQSTINFYSNSTDSLFTSEDSLRSAINFNGSGNWSLLDNLHISGNIVFIDGTFKTRGYSINCGEIEMSSNNSVTLDLDTSRVNCSYWHGIYNLNSINLYADRSTINCYYFDGGANLTYKNVNALSRFLSYDSCHYNNVVCGNFAYPADFNPNRDIFQHVSLLSNWSSNLNGGMSYIHRLDIDVPDIDLFLASNTIDSLIFRHGLTVNISSTTLTINSFLDLNGQCSGMTYFLSPDTGKIKMLSGTVNFNYVEFSNISAIGGATFNANNSINNGNVFGINITNPAPTDFYWINGTGNWNDPNHWSTISGGPAETCVPTKFDNVYFDANSFPNPNDTVLGIGTLTCKSMYWNTNNHPTFSCRYASELDIYGSLVLDTSVNWKLETDLNLLSDTSGNIINPAGRLLQHNVNISGSGEWNLQNDINQAFSINFYSGIFKTHGYKLSADDILIHNNRACSVLLDTSEINCGTWTETASSSFVIDASSSRITCGDFNTQTVENYHTVNCRNLNFADNSHFDNVSANRITGHYGNFGNINLINLPNKIARIDGFQNTSNKLTVSADNSSIWGMETTDSLYYLTPNQRITIFGIKVNRFLQMTGGCNGLIYIDSGAIILNGSGLFMNACIKKISMTGNGITATNCIDAGGNSGVIFVSSLTPRQMFWVNGTGNWDDVTHWAPSSGGSGGQCIPNISDDIHFDIHSFNSSNDTIYINTENIYGRSMTWTDSAIVNPLLEDWYFRFDLHGSIIFTNGVHWLSPDGLLDLHADQQYNEISIAGAEVQGNWQSSGSGNWFFISPFITDISKDYTFTGNHIMSKGFPVIMKNIYWNESNLDTSHIQSYLFHGTSIDGDSANIDSVYDFYDYFSDNYKYVNCIMLSTSDSCYFKNVSCIRLQSINSYFENIFFKPGTYLSADNGIVGTNNHIEKATFAAESLIISNINIFDTMSFISPGQDIELRDLSIVNNLFEVNSTPAFPTRFKSINTGTISKSSDTVCLDNIYLENIIATGGALFYAGSQSVDLGGNSGWIFSDCPLANNINESHDNFILNLYPNPSNGNITIDLSNENEESFIYTLTNISGQKIIEKETRNSSIILNRGNIEPGIYFLSLISKDRSKQYNKKIVFN